MNALVDLLTDHAAAWTGFSRDAILPEAIRRAAARLGDPDELRRRASLRDPEVVHALCQAVSVGETFFFRHPEHFRFIAATLLPELLSQKRPTIRAWSAGCATGEEAYSLAACLLDLLPHGTRPEVLGSDLLDRNLAAARAGTYGTWSRRPSGPLLHPVFRESSQDRVRIEERLRSVTTFIEHNLLDPPPGHFEIIFCRNVLVYFSPESARAVVEHLGSALAPGGALFFGPMDLQTAPAGLVASGPPEFQIFRRPGPRAARRMPAPPAPSAVVLPVPARARPAEPVALHLRALVHIERGEKKRAEVELTELARQVPDYVPGILERALLHVRMGERSAALTLMREVVRRLDKLPGDDLLPGPEPLPVSFYRESAETFLRSARGGVS